MQSYSVLQDLLHTYQSLNDGIKALWLVTPPLFVLGMTALLRRRPAPVPGRAHEGELLYSLHRMPDGSLHVLRHSVGEEDVLPLAFAPAGEEEGRRASPRVMVGDGGRSTHRR